MESSTSRKDLVLEDTRSRSCLIFTDYQEVQVPGGAALCRSGEAECCPSRPARSTNAAKFALHAIPLASTVPMNRSRISDRTVRQLALDHARAFSKRDMLRRLASVHATREGKRVMVGEKVWILCRLIIRSRVLRSMPSNRAAACFFPLVYRSTRST